MFFLLINLRKLTFTHYLIYLLGCLLASFFTYLLLIISPINKEMLFHDERKFLQNNT